MVSREEWEASYQEIFEETKKLYILWGIYPRPLDDKAIDRYTRLALRKRGQSVDGKNSPPKRRKTTPAA